MRTTTKIKIGLAILAVIGIAYTAHRMPLGKMMLDFVEWVRAQGALGVVVYVAVYIIGTILVLPATPLTVVGGFLYGAVLGTVLVAPASVLGATISFVVARNYARDWVKKKISKYPRFDAIDRAVGRQGFKMVFLMRLQPIFIPFAVLNYLLGLTRVRLRDYVFGSFLGMLPAITLVVYVGSAIQNLTRLFHGQLPNAGVWQQVLFWGGLCATIALVVIVTRITRQALQDELGVAEQPAATAAVSAGAVGE